MGEAATQSAATWSEKKKNLSCCLSSFELAVFEPTSTIVKNLQVQADPLNFCSQKFLRAGGCTPEPVFGAGTTFNSAACIF